MTMPAVPKLSVQIFVVALAVGIAAPALAQRRGDNSSRAERKHLELKLEAPLKLGGVVLTGKRYRLSVSKRGLSLINPVNMVPVATVPVLESEAKTVAPTPVVTLTRTKKGDYELTVHARDRLYTAKGEPVDVLPPQPEFQLVGRTDVDLGEVLPQEKSTLELIGEALTNRIKDVKHCADQAHRARWTTDDKRFIACVCPIAERWRLPMAEPPVRVQHPLAKGKSGISLTVDAQGKVTSCRVWVGAQPPEGEVSGPVEGAEE